MNNVHQRTKINVLNDFPTVLHISHVDHEGRRSWSKKLRTFHWNLRGRVPVRIQTIIPKNIQLVRVVTYIGGLNMNDSTKMNVVSDVSVNTIGFSHMTHENVESLFWTMEKLSLVSKTVPQYKKSLSPVENLNRLFNKNFRKTWKMVGDYIDTKDTWYYGFLKENFDRHLFGLNRRMVEMNVQQSIVNWGGTSFLVSRHGEGEDFTFSDMETGEGFTFSY